MQWWITGILCGFVFICTGQNDLMLGEWKDLLPYTFGGWVTESPGNIYYASDVGLVRINKETDEAEFFSKTNLLNDVGPQLLNYNASTESLLIIYDNSAFDILTSDGNSYVTDIKDNNLITGDRSIYQVHSEKEDVFMATGFGLIRYDLLSGLFEYTVYTNGLAVYDVTVFQNTIFISTEEGIYYIQDDPSINVLNFNLWEKIPGSAFSLPDPYLSRGISVFNNQLYALAGPDLYRLEGENAIKVYEGNYEGLFLNSGYSSLLAGFGCSSCDGFVIIMDYDENVITAADNCTDRPIFAIETAEGNLFFSDLYRGFRMSANAGAECSSRTFNSPYHKRADNLLFTENGKLIVASGGATDSYFYSYNNNGLYVYQNGVWENLNLYSVQGLAERGILDLEDVAIEPSTGRIVAASYRDGIIYFNEDNTIEVIDDENSCIQSTVGDPATSRIADLAYDQAGVLWATNFLAPDPLKAITPEGQCYSFSYGGSTNFADIVISRDGYKWVMIYGNSAGLYVLDEGELDIPGDNREATLNSSNSVLPTNDVLSLVVDREGAIWVGTNDGAVVFDCGSLIFENKCEGFRPIVSVDGILAYLLESQSITSIAVDGANRKWFGTLSGIFVMNSSGDEQIAHFNSDNSPLLSDRIRDIEIDQDNGIVYISTDEGIQAYRTDAVRGGAVHAEKLLVFPNPVRPHYKGPIAIKGLATDALVKITDMEGRLVYETQALGGQAIWEGTDLDGEEVASGVYLIFSSVDNLNTLDAATGKVLIIR